MLLQSQGERVRVLPALPDCLSDGSFTGLRARGGYKVSAVWRDGVLRSLEVHGEPGSTFSYKVPAERTAAHSEMVGGLRLDATGSAGVQFAPAL